MLLVVPLDGAFFGIAEFLDLKLYILDAILKPLFRLIAGRLVAGSCQAVRPHFVYQELIQFNCVAANLFSVRASDLNSFLDIQPPTG